MKQHQQQQNQDYVNINLFRQEIKTMPTNHS